MSVKWAVILKSLTAFSKNEKFLFSGGDDMQVQIWNLLTSAAPEPLAARRFSNIFCLSTDLYSERLLSGGNDRMVICHDLKTGLAQSKKSNASQEDINLLKVHF